MKALIILTRAIASIILITFGVNKLSIASNFDVALGIFLIVLGIAIVFKPLINLLKAI